MSYVAQACTGSTEATRVPTGDYQTAAAYLGLGSQVQVTAASPVETTIRGAGDRVAIHLIRLGTPDGLSNKSVQLEYEIPNGRAVQSVKVVSPDFPASELSHTWSVAAGRLQVQMNRLESYALAGVVLQPL